MSRIEIPVSEGITSRYVTVNGVKLHILERGAPTAPEKIMMVHGNVSSSTWWEECMLALDENKYHMVAVDLRGYGMSDAAPVDATRGMRDFADDVFALVEQLGWQKHHYWGHSMGTGVGYQYIIDHADRLKTVTLIAAMSPYGFGGTKDKAGNPCYDDYAGSGGMMFNRELMRMMGENYRGVDHMTSPLNTLRNLFVKQPFSFPREERILDALNATALGDDNLPGDYTSSPNWPNFAPGTRGVNNAMSPKYFNMSALIDLPVKPPILWVWGKQDAIVSNQSLSDIGTVGKMGLVPGYPGESVFPQQPMIDQIRDVMQKYGNFTELAFDNCGHSPQVEKFDEFMTNVIKFMDGSPN